MSSLIGTIWHPKCGFGLEIFVMFVRKLIGNRDSVMMVHAPEYLKIN